MLLGLCATLACGAEPVDAAEGAAGIIPAPIVRVAVEREPSDERLDPDAVRARRAALELPPRLVPDPPRPPAAASAWARTRAAPTALEPGARREDVEAGTTAMIDAVQKGSDAADRDAAAEADSGSAAPGTDAPRGRPAAAAVEAAEPPGSPSDSADEGVPAVHALAFVSERGEADDSEPAADEPATAASRTGRAEIATRREDDGGREGRTDALSLVVGGFLPRPSTAHAGRDGRAGETPRAGLTRPSGRRAGFGAAPSAGLSAPREPSDAAAEAARDWKLARGRWGLERGGRLSMEFDSGYRLSLKPRRGGLSLSIRRNF
jgi:hypothetical protein